MSSASKVGGVAIIVVAAAFLIWAGIGLFGSTHVHPGMAFMGMAAAAVVAILLVAAGTWLASRPSGEETHLAEQHAWRQRR